MNKYANGQIYKLENDINDKIYVGSTHLSLTTHYSNHKTMGKTRLTKHLYKNLAAVGWENVRIILIEPFPCTSRKELEQRERYWIDKLQPVLNLNKPCMTYEDYRTCQNKNERKRRMIKWRCDACNCDLINQPYHINTHKKSLKHNNNFMKQMEDVTSEIASIEPVKTLIFVL